MERTIGNRVLLFFVGSSLALLSGCASLKDPGLWQAMSQSGSQFQYPGVYQPQTFSYAPPAAVVPFPNQAPTAATAIDDLVTRLEGSVIIAEDGQFLGRITTNDFASDSILNEYGRYGSEVSLVSIFNTYAKYGNEYSRLSPFNPTSRTPPKIVSRSGHFLGYLTKNEAMTPAIDPHLLIGLLKSQ